jgi:CBS domain containing-hemolysin-like protein
LTSLHTLEIETAETLLRLAVLLLLVVVVAFFVAAELAIVSASKREINHLARQADHPNTQKAAERVQYAQTHLDQYLSVTQTGTTAGSLLLGWLGEGATVHWIEPWIRWLPLGKLPVIITSHAIATAIAFLLITYIEIALGELVPKVLAAQAPERAALWLIRPLQLCFYIFSPALFILNGTVRLLTGWIIQRDHKTSVPHAESPFIQKDSHSVMISGDVDLQTVNDQLGLNLPAHEAYRTLAGFMIHQLGRVPVTSDRVQWGELELEAMRVVENRLETILLRQVTCPLFEVRAESLASIP